MESLEYLKQQNAALAAQLDGAMQEASSLAMSIWKSEFSKEAPEFELCDSARGVISQIDNMFAGIRNQRNKLQQERNELAATVEALQKTVVSVKARGNILHSLTLQLMQGEELNGSDWDYISEVQATEIQHNLRQVRAEAIKEAVNANKLGMCNPPDDPSAEYQAYTEALMAVWYYAERIRQGGAE